MKKIVLLLIGFLLVITPLTSCSNDDQSQQAEYLQSQIDKLREENLDKDKEIADLTAAYTAKMAEFEANKQANADAIAKLETEHKALKARLQISMRNTLRQSRLLKQKMQILNYKLLNLRQELKSFSTIRIT